MRSLSVPAQAGTGRRLRIDDTVVHQQADRGVGDALRRTPRHQAGAGIHRPAGPERRVGRRAIALGDDVAALQHDERQRDPELGWPLEDVPDDVLDSILDRHDPGTPSGQPPMGRGVQLIGDSMASAAASSARSSRNIWTSPGNSGWAIRYPARTGSRWRRAGRVGRRSRCPCRRCRARGRGRTDDTPQHVRVGGQARRDEVPIELHDVHR